MNVRFALPILQALVRWPHESMISCDGQILRAGLHSVDLASGQAAGERARDRAQILARHLGLPAVDLPCLEDVWSDELRQHPTVSSEN